MGNSVIIPVLLLFSLTCLITFAILIKLLSYFLSKECGGTVDRVSVVLLMVRNPPKTVGSKGKG